MNIDYHKRLKLQMTVRRRLEEFISNGNARVDGMKVSFIIHRPALGKIVNKKLCNLMLLVPNVTERREKKLGEASQVNATLSNYFAFERETSRTASIVCKSNLIAIARISHICKWLLLSRRYHRVKTVNARMTRLLAKLVRFFPRIGHD